MTIELKTAMGLLSVAIMLAAYGVQLWKTYVGKSEPHPIAWIGFGFLTGIGFAIQWQKGAGAGSWVMGLTAMFCVLVAAMSQYKKRWHLRDFDSEDWGAFAGGVMVFAIYLLSLRLSWGALVSASLATTADLWLYLPILRRAWHVPQKENATAYALNSLKFVPSLFAMEARSFETCLYAGALIMANAFTAAYLFLRKKWLSNKPDDFAIVMLRLLDASLPVVVAAIAWIMFESLSRPINGKQLSALELYLFTYFGALFAYMIPLGLIGNFGAVDEKRIERSLSPRMSLRASQWLMGVQISNTNALYTIAGGPAGLMLAFLFRDMARAFKGLPETRGFEGFGMDAALTSSAIGIGVAVMVRLWARMSQGPYYHYAKLILPVAIPLWFATESYYGRTMGVAILCGLMIGQFTWTITIRPYECVPIEASERWNTQREYAFFPH